MQDEGQCDEDSEPAGVDAPAADPKAVIKRTAQSFGFYQGEAEEADDEAGENAGEYALSEKAQAEAVHIAQRVVGLQFLFFFVHSEVSFLKLVITL